MDKQLEKGIKTIQNMLVHLILTSDDQWDTKEEVIKAFEPEDPPIADLQWDNTKQSVLMKDERKQ